MMGIPPATLACMQGTAAGVMTTPCQILRAQNVGDGMGGWVQQWTVLQDTSCFLAPDRGALGREQEALERIEELDRVLIRLPAGTDIDIKDRIVALGATFEPQSVDAPRTIEIVRAVHAIQVVS